MLAKTVPFKELGEAFLDQQASQAHHDQPGPAPQQPRIRRPPPAKGRRMTPAFIAPDPRHVIFGTATPSRELERAARPGSCRSGARPCPRPRTACLRARRLSPAVGICPMSCSTKPAMVWKSPSSLRPRIPTCLSNSSTGIEPLTSQEPSSRWTASTSSAFPGLGHVARDGFHDVGEGSDAFDAAVFIDHDRHVQAGPLHHVEQLQDRGAVMDHQRLRRGLGKIDGLPWKAKFEQVLVVDDADNLIQFAPADRKAASAPRSGSR